MDVVPLSLDSPEPLLREWAALDAAIQAELMPDLDPPPYAQSLRNLQPVAHLNRWGVAAVDGAQVVGAGLCRSFLSDNRHLCEVDLYVAKGRRREGVGSALLSRVAAVAGRDGRTTIVGYAAAGSAGLDFATALGAVEKQGELRSSLDVSTLDREALAGELAAAEASSVDYELLRWSGVCPEDLLAAYAGVADAMNDAPRGELDMEDVVAEPERMRVRAQTVLATGARPYVVVARRTGDAELAGFTELTVAPGGGTGYQEDTGVARAHRGHRLGMRVKAAMLAWLATEEPRLRVVTTWNAENNEHMLAVNRQVGFVAQERWSALEVDVAAIRSRAAAAV
jgi:GNAT superfamily N-acetyltransferase